jgi:methionine-rich copper-binding protein CopC
MGTHMFKRYLMILLLIPITAFAHSPLSSISPAADAVLETAPTVIEMTFKSPAKLIKMELFKVNDEAKDSLFSSLFGNDNGDEITLDSDALLQESATHTIILPLLEAGVYKINWRALSEDGHVIKGESAFQITGN